MVTEPTDTKGLVYFTNRTIDGGRVMAWVYKQNCPKCGKALMSKPKDPKTGKPKIRAKEYVCPECSHTVEKKEYEETLTCEAKYTCPHCKFEGETEAPFKRKSINGVQTIRLKCGKCGGNIDVTKKMK
jgi:uncharacterized CHY-type Zn-finger protein